MDECVIESCSSSTELKHLVEIHGKNSSHKNQEPLNYDEVLIVQVSEIPAGWSN